MTSTSKTITDQQSVHSQDQSDVIAFLGLPSTYGADVDKIDLIDHMVSLIK